MGLYFGIKPAEDQYIWQVAEMGLCAPLPPGWSEVLLPPPEQPPAGPDVGQPGSGSPSGLTSEAVGGQHAIGSSISSSGGAAQPPATDTAAAPSVCFK